MKYSCPICMGSGSLVNARTDLQLTILYLVLTVQDENKVAQSTVPYL